MRKGVKTISQMRSIAQNQGKRNLGELVASSSRRPRPSGKAGVQYLGLCFL